MKMIKFLLAGLALFGAALLNAQDIPNYTVKGDIAIRYGSRSNTDGDGNPAVGATDKYALDINVANSAKLHGQIEFTPLIKKTFGSNQESNLNYLVECDVLNPKNPAQSKNVGRVYGIVPIDAKNCYHYDDGNLKTAVFGIGTAKSFDSAWRGFASGKAPAGSDGLIAKLKKEALNITKVVNGKAVTIPVSNYDRMDFQKLVLGAGPVQIYPEVIVNGTMIYDYGRNSWYFEGYTVAYILEGRQYVDKISGNIRWVESATRVTDGQGEYQFDIRVNEPAQSETAIFSGPADESAFFSTDSTIPSLTGVMKYKDTMSRDRVTSSSVTVDLTSTKLNKQQVMYLSKILFLVTVVPMNAE